MTTNINFYGKPFGAPLLPNKMTSDGWSIIDARHIGGHRVVDAVDDLYELYDWQLINPSALLNNDTNSAVGQKWYVKGVGTYMLKNYDNRNSEIGWVKIEDVSGNIIIPTSGESITTVISSHTDKITTLEHKFGEGANKADGPIVLDSNGYISPTIDTAFKKINGKSILKTYGDTSDITIDLSLFIIPANNILPTSDINPNKIYLIKDTGAPDDSGNVYVEYMYINDAWEKLGEYKSDVDLTGYLTITSAERTYVKQDMGSPSTYVLSSNDRLYESDQNDISTAVSAGLLYAVNADLKNQIDKRSLINHTHKITINGTDKTIGPDKVDLGTYLVESEFTTKAQEFTYGKVEIDNKIKGVTTSSLGISTLTNIEIDTMFTQIFG